MAPSTAEPQVTRKRCRNQSAIQSATLSKQGCYLEGSVTDGHATITCVHIKCENARSSGSQHFSLPGKGCQQGVFHSRAASDTKAAPQCTNSWSQRSTSSSEEQVRVKNSQGMSPRRLVQQSRKIHESDAAISKPKSHTKQARVLPGRFCVKRSILFARRDQRSLQRKNTIGNCCSV